MKKKSVQKSEKVISFILDKMCDEGLLIGTICRKYPTQTPAPKTFYRWESEDPELYDRVSQAYYVWLMGKMEELEYVSTTDSRILFPEIEDFRERSEARRVRLDTLKFSLGKMAPILSKRFSPKQEVHHTGDGGVILNIMDYGTKEKE
jgi:hypothetical protein